MNEPRIELVVRYGRYGDKIKVLPVTISDKLMREMKERVELSNEPLSLMFASFATESAIEIRERVFKVRRDTAHLIAQKIERMLIDEFGSDDQIDGYSKDELSRMNRQTGEL